MNKNMRKTILTLVAGVFTLASANVFAQTEAGKVLVGAGSGLGFSTEKTTVKTNDGSVSSKPTNNFSLNLNGGYFVIDNLAIGGMVYFDLSSVDGTTTLTYVAAPKLIYFVPFDSQFRPYANFYVGYSGESITASHSSDEETVTNKIGGLAIGGGVGVAYFLQSNIALSLELDYDSRIRTSKIADQAITNTLSTFAPALGFTLFF